MLIFLHGYGSNEDDLFSLTQFIPEEFIVVSSKAPIELSASSYAWYTLQNSGSKRVNHPSSSYDVKLILKRFIEEVVIKEKADSKKVVLMGFSQGAIMSLSMAINYPGLISGAAAISGRILGEDLTIKNPESKKVVFYISHGIEDKILSIDKAREAKNYLIQQKIIPTYKEYIEGHTISSEMFNDFLIWLKDLD